MEDDGFWMFEWQIGELLYDLCELLEIPTIKGTCKRCGENATFHTKDGSWWAFYCNSCRKSTSPLSYTIFKDSKLYLAVWLKGIFILRIKDPEISDRQFAEELGITAKSAHYLKYKIWDLKKDSPEYLLMEKNVEQIKIDYDLIRQK